MGYLSAGSSLSATGFDVIVVGAGPVGAYLSKRLIEEGYRVLLLERKERTGRHICAGVIGEEAFKRFSFRHDSVINSVKTITLVSPAGRKLRYKTKDPVAYIVDRVAFDSSILEDALKSGVVFRNFCRVVSVKRVNSKEMGVVCASGEGNGNSRSYRAPLVVLATGYSPRLLEAVGLSRYPGEIVGVQSVNIMRDVEGVEVYFGKNLTPGGFAWLVPMEKGRVRAGLVAVNDAGARLERFLSSSLVFPKIVRNHGRVRAAVIPMGPIPKTYGDGFLVVGEAAGQVKATTYGGVYYGLLCAEHALATIEDAFQGGEFTEKILSEYQERWQGEIGEEIMVGAMLREKALEMEDEELDNLFALLGSNGLFSRLKAAVKFDWHKDLIRLAIKHDLVRELGSGLHS